jgi:hypothetical protein
MNQVHFHLGAEVGDTLETALARTSTLPAWTPFDTRAVSFVGRFSQRLLTHPRVRAFPELAALGHWFRGAHLRDMAPAYPAETPEAVTLGRGFAFHIAPANVDSVFMYSCLISLLAGNCNWARLSQKSSPQLDFLLEVLRSTLDENVGKAVAGRIVLLTYAHDAAITTAISRACLLRVIWGGDETIAALRAIPLRPTALEICFPDRFSAAALHADSVLSASDVELRQLASGFYNDTFWFAQQACSSPRLLNWVGTPAACVAAQQRFWPAVQKEVVSRLAENTPAMGMARLGAVFELAATELAHPVDPVWPAHFPARVALEVGLNSGMKALHCGNGLFLEQNMGTLAELAVQLSDKEQTLAVFGFSRGELLDLVKALPARALDRITPIGQALAFASLWDGTDLFSVFTRRIALPAASELRATA